MVRLAGRVEKLFLREVFGERESLADLGGKSHIVKNANQYIGSEVLCRFDVRQKPQGGGLCVYFLTSQNLDQYASLGKEDYILCGLWDRSMGVRGNVPTLWEIKEYFDPGYMSSVFFFRERSRNKWGRYKISSKKIHHERGSSFSKIIRKGFLPPEKSARLAIFEEESQLYTFSEEVQNQGLTPIILEPLL